MGVAAVGSRAMTALGTAPRVSGAALRPNALGLMGGTFDPVHLGHLAIAEEAREALGLPRILFIPAAIPPHRAAASVSPAEDRAAMVALAIADNPSFELSRIELDRPACPVAERRLDRRPPLLRERRPDHPDDLERHLAHVLTYMLLCRFVAALTAPCGRRRRGPRCES